jgi:catechol 2,3-dioxygenase-like lactoylglutathione lyase family enzyme
MSRLGLRLIKESERIIGYGLTEVMFSLELPADGYPATVGNGAHVAFHAGHRDDVRACYTAGLANGGKDEGAPAIRSKYDPNYYAAFLRDPDGNKIEFVTFAGE